MLSIGAGNTGVDLTAQFQILKAFQQVTDSSIKLATLKRINRGSDDPAGLIAAESMRRDLKSMEKAYQSMERSRAVVHVVDSGLGQASALLNQIRGNVVAASGDSLSAEEKAALQLEVDAALEALDRIGNTTSFAGRKLLDGQSLQFLTGAEPGDLETLELPEVNSGSLGGDIGRLYQLRSGGAASLTGGDLELAAEILDNAQMEIVTARAEAGAFERYAIDASQQVIADTMINVSGAYSQIADTDMALESANLVRSQIMSQASIFTARLNLETRRMTAAIINGIGTTS
jgi:flagellin